MTTVINTTAVYKSSWRTAGARSLPSSPVTVAPEPDGTSSSPTLSSRQFALASRRFGRAALRSPLCPPSISRCLRRVRFIIVIVCYCHYNTLRATSYDCFLNIFRIRYYYFFFFPKHKTKISKMSVVRFATHVSS